MMPVSPFSLVVIICSGNTNTRLSTFQSHLRFTNHLVIKLSPKILLPSERMIRHLILETLCYYLVHLIK